MASRLSVGRVHCSGGGVTWTEEIMVELNVELMGFADGRGL